MIYKITKCYHRIVCVAKGLGNRKEGPQSMDKGLGILDLLQTSQMYCK